MIGRNKKGQFVKGHPSFKESGYQMTDQAKKNLVWLGIKIQNGEKLLLRI